MAHSNNLSELPDDIEDLRFLRTLRLKYNQFKRVPAVVTRLPQVTGGRGREAEVSIRSGVGATYPSLSAQMMVLELSGNQISAVGDNIGNMSILRELDLSGNMLNRY